MHKFELLILYLNYSTRLILVHFQSQERVECFELEKFGLVVLEKPKNEQENAVFR